MPTRVPALPPAGRCPRRTRTGNPPPAGSGRPGTRTNTLSGRRPSARAGRRRPTARSVCRPRTGRTPPRCPAAGPINSRRWKCRSRVDSDGAHPVEARRIRITWAAVRPGSPASTRRPARTPALRSGRRPAGSTGTTRRTRRPGNAGSTGPGCPANTAPDRRTAVMCCGPRCRGRVCRVASSTTRFQRRADQLIPEQRDRWPVPGVSHRPIGNVFLTPFVRCSAARSCCRAMTPATIPDHPPLCRVNSCCRTRSRDRSANQVREADHHWTRRHLPRRHRADHPGRAEPAGHRGPRHVHRGDHVPPPDPDALGTARSTPPAATVRNAPPHRLQRGPPPPQPAADRRSRHAEQQPDPPMTPAPRGPPATRPRSPAASARRSSTVTGNNTCVTRHPAQRARRGRSGPTPRTTTRDRAKPHGREHPSGNRARHLPARQPGLDPNLIGLYRDQRVPPHPHGPPRCPPRPTAGGPLSNSVARHTDGADHQDQPHTHAATQIGNVTDEHLPAARHPERRSTIVVTRSSTHRSGFLPGSWTSSPSGQIPKTARSRRFPETAFLTTSPCIG